MEEQQQADPRATADEAEEPHGTDATNFVGKHGR
jgi:hypothetical protein